MPEQFVREQFSVQCLKSADLIPSQILIVWRVIEVEEIRKIFILDLESSNLVEPEPISKCLYLRLGQVLWETRFLNGLNHGKVTPISRVCACLGSNILNSSNLTTCVIVRSINP